ITLEAESQACVDDASVEQCPRIDGPLSIEELLGPQQRIMTGLPNVEEIFPIYKETGRSESPFDEHAEDPVRHALPTIWVCYRTRQRSRSSILSSWIGRIEKLLRWTSSNAQRICDLASPIPSSHSFLKVCFNHP